MMDLTSPPQGLWKGLVQTPNTLMVGGGTPSVLAVKKITATAMGGQVREDQWRHWVAKADKRLAAGGVIQDSLLGDV